MKTTIKDLPRNEKMDSSKMATIQGGGSFPSVLNSVVPNLRMVAPPPSPPYHGNPLPPTGDSGGFPDGDSGGYNLNFGGDDGTGHHQD